MKCALLIYTDEAAMARADQNHVAKVIGAYGAWTTAMREAGIFIGADRLQPSITAATVRGDGTRTKVLDGPYAETKEQLGGFFIIDVPDLEDARSWAGKCPSLAWGAVEVRPLFSM